jgi:hypothetical protein
MWRNKIEITSLDYYVTTYHIVYRIWRHIVELESIIKQQILNNMIMRAFLPNCWYENRINVTRYYRQSTVRVFLGDIAPKARYRLKLLGLPVNYLIFLYDFDPNWIWSKDSSKNTHDKISRKFVQQKRTCFMLTDRQRGKQSCKS